MHCAFHPAHNIHTHASLIPLEHHMLTPLPLINFHLHLHPPINTPPHPHPHLHTHTHTYTHIHSHTYTSHALHKYTPNHTHCLAQHSTYLWGRTGRKYPGSMAISKSDSDTQSRKRRHVCSAHTYTQMVERLSNVCVRCMHTCLYVVCKGWFMCVNAYMLPVQGMVHVRERLHAPCQKA